ncbi:MAG: acyl-CoA dehydrogenase family protein [Rhodocyclales bacterium]|nr:acyl-CoA dehydrogenase family protein [Rhodocyclales bacterium]
MNFDFNEDQRALADTVRRFVAKDYGFERRRAIRDSASGWSRAVWQELAELGVLAVGVGEGHGGLGYGPLETGLVMNAFGAGLLLEPYLAAAVVAPALIRRATSADFQDQWLPRIATGDSIVVFAHQDGRGEAVRAIDGKLSGRKTVVTHADCADLLLVSARAADGGVRLFALAPAAPGVTLRGYPTLDGQRAADLLLDQATATEVGAGDTANNATQAIDAALDIGLAALCAEAIGIMEATVAATVDYLKTRRQFGQPIGRFQALQHRMADMLLHQEQSRSMSYLAAMQCTNPDQKLRQRTLSAAKVTIGQACRFIAQNAVQLHGGMGMTDELILSHWFKRLTAIEMSFGDTDFHLQRFAAQLSREAQAA